MAISLEILTSIFSQESKAESVISPPQAESVSVYDNRGFFADYQAIFGHYGINHNAIDPSQVTKFETNDGILCVNGPQCNISPPPGYYTSLLRSNLIRS